ncbi:MAG TPA: YceI family protein [Myxococcaceae bacterium]|nr:YceI family protein [Myxococcaceae bacterium]
MRPSLHCRGLMLFVCSLVLTAAGFADAAIGSPSGAAVLFSARGTAGLNIEGVTHEMALEERDGNVVFRVPLAGLDTGIGLRNRHLRGYLDVTHFPVAELDVSKSLVALASPGTPKESDATGTLTLHGVSKPCSIHYRVEQVQSGEYRVHGTTRIDIRDFGIAVPTYLGITVDPAVAIQVDFSVHDQ